MSKYKMLIVPVILSSLFGLPALATADTLSIINQPANTAEGVQRPERGLTKQQVESLFGSPLEKIPAVGEPPISRWVYDKYTVYFEHEYVIHSAVHHKPQDQ
jgi:outer membrane protein assembly factor BamE (lipoprotein component of BamABCDE complex)